jgi:hypothetical protein
MFREQCGAIGQGFGDAWRLDLGPALLASAFGGLALAGFETALRLVDHIDAALAAHETVVPVPPAQRFQ